VQRAHTSGARRNPAYVITDTPEEIDAVLEALRASMADSSTTILEIESLQERFPVREEAQQEKLVRIASIREELDDPLLEDNTSDDLAKLRRAASTTRPITDEEVPQFLKNEFTSKTGEIGNFVIIYPRYGLSNGRNSIAFADEVGSFEAPNGKVYHAGSTSIVAADMLRLMRSEAPYMIALTFAVVVILMIINFGSIRWAALATVPLVVGVMWMLLLMGLFDLRLNFYNLIVLPAVLGIGNDAGVHLVHRYREAGPGSMRGVLRSTGEHIFVGALTTMIGFSGPLLSFHPGLRSIGVLAVIGIGTTLLAAIVFLPALVQRLESRTDLAEDADHSDKTDQADQAAQSRVSSST
jgi:predicted RND superfamily exporter protein